MAGHKREIIGPTRRGSIIGHVDAARQIVQAAQAQVNSVPGVFVGAKGGSKRKPRPLPMRVDSPETYMEFVSKRAVDSPSLPALANSVAELRELLLEHMADGHGAHDVIAAAADVSLLRDKVVEGDKVPVSLDPKDKPFVRFWRDGDVLCCSIRRIRGADRGERILTACAPVADSVTDVLGFTEDAGVDPLENLAFLPTLSLMHGGGVLFDRLKAASQDPKTRSCSIPCKAVIESDGRVTWRA